MGMTDLMLRLRALVSRQRAESDLDDELSFHLEMEERKKRLEGVPEAEARRQARVAFHGVERVREECRDARGLRWAEDLARDVRYGWRVLRKTPGFSLIALASLAIGIGANTAVFSLVDRVLLRRLPVRNPQELVILKWGARREPRGISKTNCYNDGDRAGFRTNVFSWQIFTAMRERSRALNGITGFTTTGETAVTANGQAQLAQGMLVTGNYFAVLGIGTVMGRPIVDDNDTLDGVPAAVISYRFWERAFGMDPGAIGKTIYVNGDAYAVAGITPRAYSGVSAGDPVDFCLPIRAIDRIWRDPKRPGRYFAEQDLFWVQAMGRLQPGSDVRPAEAELGAILAAGMPERAVNDKRAGPPHVEVLPGNRGLEFLRARFQEPLIILLAVVGTALLMTCANLAGLLLARATWRQREIAVRLAMGAGRWRVVRQLLVEGALLSAGGALVAVLLAHWGVRALVGLFGSDPARPWLDVSTDGRVLLFTAAVAVATTVLFGLAPALRATRWSPSNGLKDAPVTAGSGRRFGSAGALLAMQIAVAVVLVAGAGLFTRTLANLRSIPLGFNAEKMVLFGLAPGRSGYDEARALPLYASVLDRLRQIPGVTAATLSGNTLLSGWSSSNTVLVGSGGGQERRGTYVNHVGPEFFGTMQIPIVFGRGIEQRDIRSTSRVAVLSEGAAREFYGAEPPVGQRFRWTSAPDAEIQVIGVARDAKYDHLKDTPTAVVYTPYTQASWGWPTSMNYEVRTAADPAFTTAAIRAAVREIDRMLPLSNVKTMEVQIDEALAQERLFASLVSLFGAITLGLACVGIYGAVSYSVTRRTREIGVRMALGANRATVLRMLLGQVALVAAAGLAAGIPASRALARLVESKLYGVEAGDLPSMIGATLMVSAVAVLAALIPARRATRVDPAAALRCD
jgi:predicted permease